MSTSRFARMLCVLFACLAASVSLFAQSDDDAAVAECRKVSPTDQRCLTEVSLYTGLVVDSFAAEDLNAYINPNDANTVKTSFIAGIDVQQYLGRNTWLYIETVNGVRSVDVDCAANPNVSVCQDNPATNTEFLYIIRNARTLEALAGVRKEFPWAATNGSLYGKSQLGFISVAGGGKDIVDNHIYLAGGFLTADDTFKGSYVEVGVGKSDFFERGRNSRIKFDGYLTGPVTDITRWFLQMTVDSDFRNGPDSIQIYLGMDVNLRGFKLNL